MLAIPESGICLPSSTNKEFSLSRIPTDKPLSALDAITAAQKIAFAPVLFQTAWCLRETGLLSFFDQHPTGASAEEAATACALTPYAASVLLDMGVSGEILLQQPAGYSLSKIGHFLLHDPMTRVNMEFTQHVCYQAMGHLLEAIQQGKPAGLKVFGDWPTIYPALSQLPEAAKTSWFDFDHFYSDHAFEAALPHILDLHPSHLYDVGGNTGKWALMCAQADPQLQVTLLDLPQQLALAQVNIEAAGVADRVHGHAVDLLQAQTLPGEADIWWMSQFLDCFSEAEIINILCLIRSNMKPDARVCILELFWDRQEFEAASFSLNATSLYFTCLANGNSRFYHSKVMNRCLRAAGFRLESEFDNIGRGHTLLVAVPC
jgi:ubiquinone/menaquinone biosynthesis C-methylase UbiE